MKTLLISGIVIAAALLGGCPDTDGASLAGMYDMQYVPFNNDCEVPAHTNTIGIFEAADGSLTLSLSSSERVEASDVACEGETCRLVFLTTDQGSFNERSYDLTFMEDGAVQGTLTVSDPLGCRQVLTATGQRR